MLAGRAAGRDHRRPRTGAPFQLTGIHLNLEAQAVEFEDRHGTVGRLRFTGETVLYEGRPLLLLPNADPATPAEPLASPLQDLPRAADPDAPLFHNPSSHDPRGEF